MVAGGLATGLLLASAIDVAGPKGAIAPLAAIVCVVLLRFPSFTFGALLVATVLAETEENGVLPSIEAFYEPVVAGISAPELLLLLGLAGVAIRFVTEDRRPVLPEPLTIPLLLVLCALAIGVIGGLGASPPVERGDLLHRSAHVLYLILVPLLAVNVLEDTRALKLFAGIAAALAALKGATGLIGASSGIGGAVEAETASFLDPLPNLMMLALVLGAIAAVVRRVRVPPWVLATAPLAALALLLSYRRSFWIAAVFSIVVVAIVASRRRGRTVLAIGALAFALTLGAALTIGSSDDPSASPLAERARTLTPGGIGSNRGDRYRVDERRNVIENIEQQPLVGIGLGVPWKVHEPLAEDHDRRYAHVAMLWYWLTFGLLGVIAYLTLIGSSLWLASRIWRGHPDPVVQITAIACFGALIGLAIVELTATFTGVEPRLSLIVGAALGWLCAAWRDLPRLQHAGPGAR